MRPRLENVIISPFQTSYFYTDFSVLTPKEGLIIFVPNKSILAVLFASLLLMGLPLRAEAQFNNPSATEQANLNLVIRNIQSLIDGYSGSTSGGATQLGTSGFLNLDHLRDILTNLRNLNDTHRIKSVPGLENGSAQYAEAGGSSEKVVAAYCPPGGYTTIHGQPCPGDTIVVDPQALDPNHGTPLDENNIDDWTKKWDLASTLVHEKQHEMYVKAALDELHGRAWWPTYPKQGQKENLTITQALSSDNHKQVYQIQKDTLKALIKLLEYQKAHSHVASEKQDLANKIKRIKGLLDNLKEKEKKVFGGGALAKFESCGWPNDLHNGFLALIMTSPGVWERLDIQINNDTIINQAITQTEWDGEYDLFSPVTNNPSLFITASEQVLFDLSALDASCEYYKELIQTGNITASLASPVNFIYVPGWFKNDAAWLAEGQVGEKEYAMAIGYLVQQGILNVESRSTANSIVVVSDNIQIPSSMKSRADAWSKGFIQDSDFLQDVQYMIDNNMITFSAASQASLTSSASGGMVTLKIVDQQTNQPVDAIAYIQDSNGRTFQQETDRGGIISLDLLGGTYTVTIDSADYQRVIDTIEVNGNTQKTFQLVKFQSSESQPTTTQAPGTTHQTPSPNPPSTNPTPPTTSPSPQVSANPTTLSFVHNIGMTSCPEAIGQVSLQSNQQGTWSVLSNPSWTSVTIQNNVALVAFNCQLSQYVTQTLSGGVLFQFTGSNGVTATANVSITGQVNQG